MTGKRNTNVIRETFLIRGLPGIVRISEVQEGSEKVVIIGGRLNVGLKSLM